VPVFISMLRGVNLGPHNRIKMDALRATYEAIALEDPRTYVQSGNVIFRTKEKALRSSQPRFRTGLRKVSSSVLP